MVNEGPASENLHSSGHGTGWIKKVHADNGSENADFDL